MLIISIKKLFVNLISYISTLASSLWFAIKKDLLCIHITILKDTVMSIKKLH